MSWIFYYKYKENEVDEETNEEILHEKPEINPETDIELDLDPVMKNARENLDAKVDAELERWVSAFNIEVEGEALTLLGRSITDLVLDAIVEQHLNEEARRANDKSKAH